MNHFTTAELKILLDFCFDISVTMEGREGSTDFKEGKDNGSATTLLLRSSL